LEKLLRDPEGLSETTERSLQTHIENCEECRQVVEDILRDPESERWRKLYAACPLHPDQNGGSSLGSPAGPFAFSKPLGISFSPSPYPGYEGRLEQFHIVRELGQGAMGVVFLAWDEHLDQMVTIKVLKPELAAVERFRSRFVREGRSAAAVRHENVVAIFHAHETHGLRLPYLLMEYIEGETLEERLKRGPLSSREAVEIARQVVAALAAAHNHNLVHRDVKPSNVLLEKHSGRAKVSDFGLARALDGSDQITRSEALVGTAPYMSPEQIQEPRAADVRSDLFSFGIVLYEMLTGERPFRGTHSAVMQQIVYEEPISPRKLNHAIERDLETITLKCLAKEPSRRYQTAQELAEDLSQWLNGQPVRARPLGTAGKIWRWCRRDPFLAAASGVAAAALLFATAVSSLFGLHRAKAAEQARNTSEFLVGLLQASEPVGIGSFPFGESVTESRRLSVRQFLDKEGQKRVIEAFKDQPAVQTRLMDTLGNLCRSLALYPEAKILLESSRNIRQTTLGDKHADVANSLYYLAWLYHDQGDYEKAERLFQEALAIHRSKGNDNSLVDSLKFNLAWLLTDMEEYASAEQLFSDVRKKRRQQPGGKPREVAIASIGLAVVWLEQGRGQEALRLIPDILGLFQDEESGRRAIGIIASTVRGIAMRDALKMNYASAEESLRKCVDICRLSLGDQHPYVTIFLTELALTQEKMGDVTAAEKSYRECLEIAGHTNGYWHPRIVKQTRRLATLLARNGRYAEGERLFEELLQRSRQESEDNDRRVADALAVYGWFLAEYQDKNKAEQVLREALGIFGKTPSQFTMFHELCLTRLGRVLVTTGRYAEAESLLLESRKLMQRRLGKGYPARSAPVLSDLAWALIRQGKETEGESVLRAAPRIDPSVFTEEPKDLVSRASIFSLAAAAAANDIKLREAERDKFAEQYAHLALELLRRAHRGGYFKNPAEIERLTNDADLAPLQSREDFKRLVQKLNATSAN
jgi:serine/threonine protein kinase/Tfp pilus assembly protein PilF